MGPSASCFSRTAVRSSSAHHLLAGVVHLFSADDERVDVFRLNTELIADRA